MIKHIIYDFGGVILKLDNNKFSIPQDLAVLFDISVEKAIEVWREHHDMLLTGRETPKDFIQRVNIYLRKDLDISQTESSWEKRYKIEKEHINWELVAWISKLKEHYKIHMLTDAIALNNGASSWIGEIEDHFHGFYRSYEQKLKKPDSKAFFKCLNENKS